MDFRDVVAGNLQRFCNKSCVSRNSLLCGKHIFKTENMRKIHKPNFFRNFSGQTIPQHSWTPHSCIVLMQRQATLELQRNTIPPSDDFCEQWRFQSSTRCPPCSTVTWIHKYGKLVFISTSCCVPIVMKNASQRKKYMTVCPRIWTWMLESQKSALSSHSTGLYSTTDWTQSVNSAKRGSWHCLRLSLSHENRECYVSWRSISCLFISRDTQHANEFTFACTRTKGSFLDDHGATGKYKIKSCNSFRANCSAWARHTGNIHASLRESVIMVKCNLAYTCRIKEGTRGQTEFRKAFPNWHVHCYTSVKLNLTSWESILEL